MVLQVIQRDNSTNIVLQAGRGNIVWGYHALSSEPSFSFATLFKDGVLAVTMDVEVSADGYWTIQLPSQEAGTGYLLTIQSGEQSVEIQVTQGYSQYPFLHQGPELWRGMGVFRPI